MNLLIVIIYLVSRVIEVNAYVRDSTLVGYHTKVSLHNYSIDYLLHIQKNHLKYLDFTMTNLSVINTLAKRVADTSTEFTSFICQRDYLVIE